MSLEYYFRAADGTLVGPVTNLADTRVRLYTLDVTQNAEEGAVASSRVTIDDPDGDLDITGLRLFAVKETATATGSNFIFAGYTTDRKISREGFRTTVARKWDVGLVDANTILEDRVMVGADCNRPAETDVARITWLLTTAEASLITDTRYFSTDNPESMDAVDYRGQTFKGIIDDCAQQSGKNYYITWFEDTATANLPWGTFSLWYGDAASTDYSSTIQLSNDPADIDTVTTFAISQENTVLTRDPSRVYSGMLVPYDGGTAYVQRPDTVADFKRRDGVSPAQNVKTAAKAERRGNRMLADIDTEDDVIATEFQVPAAQVNDLREGMRIPFKATHLPGYSTGQWVRCLNRNVVQDSELTYKIKVELSPTGAEVIIAQNLLIAIMYVGGPSQGASPPTDISTNSWTQAFWTGRFDSAGQFPGPGPPAGWGMWYRQVVPGESATVIQLGGGASKTIGCWVYQVAGASSQGLTSVNGIDTLNYAFGALSDVDSPSAAISSVFVGGFMLQKVTYGQVTGLSTALGTELINANGANISDACDIDDGNPPRVWMGYRTGAGVLTVGATLTCDGAGPGDYNHYGRGTGGLLLPLGSAFSVVQSAFAVAVGADVTVTLPAPP